MRASGATVLHTDSRVYAQNIMSLVSPSLLIAVPNIRGHCDEIEGSGSRKRQKKTANAKFVVLTQ